MHFIITFYIGLKMCAISSYINRVLQPRYNIYSHDSDQSNGDHLSSRFFDGDQEAMKNEIHRQVFGGIESAEKKYKRSTEDSLPTETAEEKNVPNLADEEEMSPVPTGKEEMSSNPIVEKILSLVRTVKVVESPNPTVEEEDSPVFAIEEEDSPVTTVEDVVSPVPTDEILTDTDTMTVEIATNAMTDETATDAPIDETNTNAMIVETATDAPIDDLTTDSSPNLGQFFVDKANLDALVFNIKDKQGKIIESLESYHKQTVLNMEESKKINHQLHVLTGKQRHINEEKNKYETEGLLLNLNDTIIRKNINVLNADRIEFSNFLNSTLKNLGYSVYENTTDLEEDSDKKSKCYDGTQVYDNFLALDGKHYEQHLNSYTDSVAKINEIIHKKNVTNELLNSSANELRKITQTIAEKNVEKAKNENEYDRIKSFDLQNELASLKSLQEEYKQKKDVFIRKYSSYMQNLPQKDGAEDATGDLIYNEDFFTKMDNIYKQTCEIQIEYVKDTIKELEFAKNSTEQLELCKNSTEQPKLIENVTDINNSATTSDYSTKVIFSMIILHFYGKFIVLQ